MAIPFLLDADGNRIEPPRIAFYLDKVLDVITGISPICNCNNSSNVNSNRKVVIRLPISQKLSNLTSSHELLLPISNLVQSFNQSFTGNNAQAEMINSNLEKIAELLLEAKEKDDKIIEPQLEAKEKNDKMLELQSQALDRLAILQKQANAILTQNFELYEYPIPRLFIILPDNTTTKWDPRKVLRNKFRLYFLCECGDHTAETSKSIQNQIHIAKHDGYEVRDSTEFFRKYGKYMLILLQMLKLGMGATPATSLTPGPNLIDAAIAYSIAYMGTLSKKYPVLDNANAIDDYGELEGADLRQLDTFLRINDEGRKLGNLYRITTETGRVKWVCFEHYRWTYREAEQKVFENAVETNGGEYDSHLGKVVITLESKTRAGEFFDALTNARRVYELVIAFRWQWTKTDLEAFEKALKMSSVSILRLDLGEFQGSTTRKILSTSLRYEILVRIMEISNMKTIHIALSPDLIKFSNLQPRRSSQLHQLSFKVQPQSIRAGEYRVIANSLKSNTALTALDLRDNLIGEEGALTLSKALKTNTTLATLNLLDNSIGKEGAVALSEALKTNRTLAILDVEYDSFA